MTESAETPRRSSADEAVRAIEASTCDDWTTSDAWQPMTDVRRVELDAALPRLVEAPSAAARSWPSAPLTELSTAVQANLGS